MRKIKFRAWDKIINNIKLLSGFNFPNLYNIDLYGILNQSCRMMKNDIILMQYTGLKDKNGKEIYEGDILDTTQSGKCKVVFTEGCFFMDFIHSRFPICTNDYEIEVIGNIHENPELLK